jgi:hypothetical protein
MVGVHHEHGLSVPQDLSLAYAWHRLAAERGNPKLMELRDIRKSCGLAGALEPGKTRCTCESRFNGELSPGSVEQHFVHAGCH